MGVIIRKTALLEYLLGQQAYCRCCFYVPCHYATSKRYSQLLYIMNSLSQHACMGMGLNQVFIVVAV